MLTASSSPLTASSLLSVAIEISRLLAQLAVLVDSLVAQLQAPPIEAGAPVLKRPDGRLTEAGIDTLYADFAADVLSNDEIAAKHEISVSGVVKRKAMWKRGER